MPITIDHVVLWVADPLRSVEFYGRVLGAEPVRVDEFRAGTARFPSVRLSPVSILDLAPAALAPMVNAMGGVPSAGHPIHHVCLAMSKDEVDALRARVAAEGVRTREAAGDIFGARGNAPGSFYFVDLDGNVVEARYYE